MKGNIFSFIVLGIMLVAGLFAYIPFSQVNLTDQGTEQLGTFNVQQEWGENGILYNLETDGDIIYPASGATGNWTSFLIEGDDMDIIDISTVGDVRDGIINASILLYENESSVNGADKVKTVEVDQPDFSYRFTNVSEQYDYFKVRLTLEEQAGSNNQRPNIDGVAVNYIENLDRSGLGLDSNSFQAFTLLVFIGSAMFALMRSV